MEQKILRAVAPAGALVAILVGCDFSDGDGNSAVDEAQIVVEEFVAVGLRQDGDESDTRAGISAVPGGKTRIVIEMEEPSEPLLRAEIRPGDCVTVTSAAEYPLNDVKKGKSETVLDVRLREIRLRNSYMIMIRRLSEPNEFSGLCGDIYTAEEN